MCALSAIGDLRRSVLLLISVFALTLLGTNASQADADTPKTEFFETKEGPWGKLQCYYFYLEAPDSVIARIPLPDTQARWKIPEDKLESFQALVSQTELSNEVVSDLFTPRRVISRGKIVNLFPSHNLIESLTAKDREKIYVALGSFPDNEFYEYPIFFLSGSVREWAEDSGLREGLVQTIEKLSYKRGNALAFSDIPTLLNRALSNSEAQFIKKKLTRTRTLIARLELTEKTNVSSILDYWSTGLNLRRKEMEPLMKATCQLPGTQYLDLLHLLPALPRKLLYTYPGDEFTTHIRLPDCHWTTLNFFNYTAQNYFLDSELAASTILENFVQVEPPYRFGDVLMFINNDGNAFHSCVYLADEIAYSKNGNNPLLPWSLIEIKDLRTMYNIDLGEGRIQGFRHKDGKNLQSD